MALYRQPHFAAAPSNAILFSWWRRNWNGILQSCQQPFGISSDIHVSESECPTKGRIWFRNPCVGWRVPSCTAALRFESADDNGRIAVKPNLYVLALVHVPSEFASPDQLSDRIKILLQPGRLVLHVP